MARIYHLVPRRSWSSQDAGPYRADSLEQEGFIHCSRLDQVARIANLFFQGEADLLALEIEVERLTSPVREEDAGTGELFPHVYGPIDRGAIVRVNALRRGPDGQWLSLE